MQRLYYWNKIIDRILTKIVNTKPIIQDTEQISMFITEFFVLGWSRAHNAAQKAELLSTKLRPVNDKIIIIF